MGVDPEAGFRDHAGKEAGDGRQDAEAFFYYGFLLPCCHN